MFVVYDESLNKVNKFFLPFKERGIAFYPLAISAP